MFFIADYYYIISVYDPEFKKLKDKWVTIATTVVVNDGAVEAYMGDDSAGSYFMENKGKKETTTRGIVVIADTEDTAKKLWLVLDRAVNR